MTLPEIPSEAQRAAGLARVPENNRRVWESCTSGVIPTALAAAWPHLYAAALRHAAVTFDESWSWSGDQLTQWPGTLLRRMADDVETPPAAPEPEETA